jgi:CHAT domain-containing protein/Tfp pilus assembly protein PilF
MNYCAGWCARLALLALVTSSPLAIGTTDSDIALRDVERRLSEVKDTFGNLSLVTAEALDDVAVIHNARGDYPLAERYFSSALQIRISLAGEDSLVVSKSLNYLGNLYGTIGRHSDAEASIRRALSIRERLLGSSHPDVVTTLNNLATHLHGQGQYEQAKALNARVIEMLTRNADSDAGLLITSLSNSGWLHADLGEYETAEQLFSRVLELTQKRDGPFSRTFAESLDNMAEIYRMQGRLEKAEPLYLRAIQILESRLGENHPDIAIVLGNLATFYGEKARHDLARPLLKRVLQIREMAFGQKHERVAAAIANLADHYLSTGELQLAEDLYNRASTILKETLGIRHPEYANLLNNLGLLKVRIGKLTEAEAILKESLDIRTATFGSSHPSVANTHHNLASVYEADGKYTDAITYLSLALPVLEKNMGLDHPSIGSTLNSLAVAHAKVGENDKAITLFLRALAIRGASYGMRHTEVADTAVSLSYLYLLRKEYGNALLHSQTASTIYRDAISTSKSDKNKIIASLGMRMGFRLHIEILSLLNAKDPTYQRSDESFQLAQLQNYSDVSNIVTQPAARFSKGDDALANLIRIRQDLIEQWNRLDRLVIRTISGLTEKHSLSDLQKLRATLTTTETQIKELDREINRRFPEFEDMVSPRPTPIESVQKLLQPKEALVTYAFGRTSWLWVVTQHDSAFIPIDISEQALHDNIRNIRTQMQPNEHGELPQLDLLRLNELYKLLIAPADSYLNGIEHLIVVPSGPIQSLPFGMLVSALPSDPIRLKDYGQIGWLAKRFSSSVLPSVGTLRALRTKVQRQLNQQPFIGFGDPSVGDEYGATRRSRHNALDARIARASFRQSLSVAEPGNVMVADSDAIRKMSRLPEATEELSAMAKILGADENSIWVGTRATESNLKQMDLTNYRILALATHGVMANELGPEIEPGLILTPPNQPTIDDDGYLTSSEISQLKLQADWVLLSACNTAASDGSPGAEGLSGLAKAFFYAGSRTLFVSHWPVDSAATVLLTTKMLEAHKKNPERGKAQAHQESVLSMINSRTNAEYSHPFFWAPFIVVGEAGIDETVQ